MLGAGDGSTRLQSDDYRSVWSASAQIQLSAPEYAVVDLRLDDGCGLDAIAALKQQRPNAPVIISTSYGNIATAVKAIKLGAIDYLTKPVDADDIVCALLVPAPIFRNVSTFLSARC